MQILTINNQQLLFVRVPMNAYDPRFWEDSGVLIVDINFKSQPIYHAPFEKGTTILGTIQNEKGIISTTIPDDVLEELTQHIKKVSRFKNLLRTFIAYLRRSGLPLQEGDKYAVLKIK